MKSFQKSIDQTNKLFKKGSSDVNRFFKKDGQFQKVVGKTASGLGSVGKVIGQGVRTGNQILSGIESSPYGSAFAPITGVARSALGVAGMAGKTAQFGKGALRDVISGGNAGQIVNRTLQGAKQLERDSNNALERSKPKEAQDSVQFV